MIGYGNSFENAKAVSNMAMYFKISVKRLLKKYNQIWTKVKNLLNIKFNSEYKFWRQTGAKKMHHTNH